MSFGTMPNLIAWLRAFLRPHIAAPGDAPARLAAETLLLAKLHLARERLAPLAATNDEAAAAARELGQIETRLRRPIRLALLGEFNTGKSSLAHLLLGRAPPSSTVIPDTRAPVLFRYAARPALFMVGEDRVRRSVPSGAAAPGLGAEAVRVGRDQTSIAAQVFVGRDQTSIAAQVFVGRDQTSIAAVRLIEARLPLDLLRRVEILDVPGTANPAADDTPDLLPQAVRGVHFALWCTSATQAWKGSEQRAWLALPPRLRAASLLVATHIDRLRLETDREKVSSRLRRETAGLFRAVVMISATQRTAAIEHNAPECEKALREGANMELWHAPGGAQLWQCLMDAVAAVAAMRVQSAARVAQRIAAQGLSPEMREALAPLLESQEG